MKLDGANRKHIQQKKQEHDLKISSKVKAGPGNNGIGHGPGGVLNNTTTTTTFASSSFSSIHGNLTIGGYPH